MYPHVCVASEDILSKCVIALVYATDLYNSVTYNGLEITDLSLKYKSDVPVLFHYECYTSELYLVAAVGSNPLNQITFAFKTHCMSIRCRYLVSFPKLYQNCFSVTN